LRVRPLRTRYWRPGCDYVRAVAKAVQPHIRDGDIVVVSEKAISTAKGNLIDESLLSPGLTSRLLARFWMRIIWAYTLGVLCRFRPPTMTRLRSYPLREGSKHKELVLRRAGLLHALKYGSEGGIDLSNLPYSFASLPLENPEEEAERILEGIVTLTRRRPAVVVSDTDSTFSLGSFHFTSRPKPLKGIHAFPGPLPFIVGRALRIKQRATPLAVAGTALPTETALKIAERAHHARGYGAGRTVYDISQKHGAKPFEVTWEMLEHAKHYPVVLVRLS
jgi:F420-0:gamma-glutamyl ligase-like protein